MKPSAILIMMALLIVTASSFIPKHAKTSGVVDIIDVRKTKEPNDNVANHKERDVKVYRTMFMGGDQYKVSMYREDKNQLNNVAALKCYSAYYSADGDMDKAEYKWLNDTLVSFRLYNSVSNKDVTIKISGNGADTRLMFNDK